MPLQSVNQLTYIRSHTHTYITCAHTTHTRIHTHTYITCAHTTHTHTNTHIEIDMSSYFKFTFNSIRLVFYLTFVALAKEGDHLLSLNWIVLYSYDNTENWIQIPLNSTMKQQVMIKFILARKSKCRRRTKSREKRLM